MHRRRKIRIPAATVRALRGAQNGLSSRPTVASFILGPQDTSSTIVGRRRLWEGRSAASSEAARRTKSRAHPRLPPAYHPACGGQSTGVCPGSASEGDWDGLPYEMPNRVGHDGEARSGRTGKEAGNNGEEWINEQGVPGLHYLTRTGDTTKADGDEKKGGDRYREVMPGVRGPKMLPERKCERTFFME